MAEVVEPPDGVGGPPEEDDDVMEGLRRTVAERRAAGDYPVDLEQRLAGHFDRIRRLRDNDDHLKPLREAVADLDVRSEFSLGNNVASRLPLGEQYHRAVAHSVRRQVGPLVEQIRTYTGQLREVLEVLIHRLDSPGPHVHADLLGQIDAALDRLGQLGSMPAGDLTLPGPRGPDATSLPSPGTWYDRDAHETWVRGPAEQLRTRYRSLLEAIVVAGPVLELGSGRGELVEVLVEHGVMVEGWEDDRSLAAIAQARSLPVRSGPGLEALARAADESLGAVMIVRTEGALGAADLADAVAMAAARLRPDGCVVISAADPESPDPVARRARSDPEGGPPFYPEAVEFLCRQALLTRVERYVWSPSQWVEATGSTAAEAPLFAVVARR